MNSSAKHEYRVYIRGKPAKHGWSSIDHVWIKSIPCPNGKKREVVVVAFEITKDLDTL